MNKRHAVFVFLKIVAIYTSKRQRDQRVARIQDFFVNKRFRGNRFLIAAKVTISPDDNVIE